MSIPLRNHKGVLNLVSVQKKFGGLVKGAKGQLEEKDMGLRRSILRSTNLTTP